MAVNILSADSSAQWIANTTGDTYVLKEGVYLGFLGTAINGTAAVINRKFQIDGHVIGEGGGSGMFIGQDAANGGYSTIHIGATGSVLGEAYGIVAHGGGLNFTNMGSLTGGTAGLFLSGSNNAVLNQGAILSYDGIGINSQGAFAEIQNNGAIMAETCGVKLEGAASTLVNNGSISSADNSFSTTGVHITGGNSVFVNNGTVSSNGGRVILGSSSSEGVVNRGEIYGYVDLGDGSDTFVNDGGSVFGGIDLGKGDDSFSSKNGFFDGSVTGGDGDDQYYIYDTLTEIVEKDYVTSGFDTVHAFVSYSLEANFEALILKGGADLAGSGNSLANYLVGNAGDNKLYGRGGDDEFYASEGNDQFDGGGGTDWVYYDSGVASGVSVNLASGKGGGAALGQTYIRIENVAGSEFKDQITGNGLANRLDGFTGNDLLRGGGGKDVFVFVDSWGKDTIADFHDKQDKIALDFNINGVDINNFGDLNGLIKQKGSDVVIDFTSISSGDMLVLRNMHVSDLSAADFIFG